MVRLPTCLSVEISKVLGNIILNRLATQEAQPWQKTLVEWNDIDERNKEYRLKKQKLCVPEVPWPIEAVLFVYPNKLVFGKNEVILWELELIGDSADHGLFLELILPAMEEAGYTFQNTRNQRNKLWGKFDVYAVYVARGLLWDPLVKQGRLNLRYHPTPKQWAKGLPLESKRIFNSIKWVTPFDFSKALCSSDDIDIDETEITLANNHIPTLPNILRSFIFRVNQILSNKRKTKRSIWDILSEEERSSFHVAMKKASESTLVSSNLNPPSNDYPGLLIGTQHFSAIHSSLIPYLELASIFHIGKQTHFGCGTFILE